MAIEDVVSQYQDLLSAILLILFSILLARVFYLLVIKKLPELLKRTKSSFDEKVVERLERHVYVGIILIGLYFALSSVNVFHQYHLEMNVLFGVLAVLWGTTVAVRIANVYFVIQIENAKNKTGVEKTIMQNTNKVVNGVIYIIGFLLVLRTFGIDITVLIAGLGIGGFAFALAFQNTLSNYFAGIYMTTDRSVALGDYIELENGMQGYVEKIGWRTTRIKTVSNNIVTLPNAKLSEMILTNFYHHDTETWVKVACGVEYSSDLKKVEKLTVEVALQVLKENAGGVLDPAPYVAYNKFGDSNIEFTVFLRIGEYTAKEKIVHEFIKALSEAYEKKGIEIAYPSRNVYMKKG